MKLSRAALFVIISSVIILALPPRAVKADGVSVDFEVEGPTDAVFNQSVLVSSCATPSNATSTLNGFCAFAAANLPVEATSSDSGVTISSINNIAGNWQWFLNGNFQNSGIDNYTPQVGDSILWALGREPLKVSLSTTTPAVNAAIMVTVLGFNPSTLNFEPISGAQIVGTSGVTDASGQAEILATSSQPFTISVTASGYIPSQEFTITPQVATGGQEINLIIRYGNVTAFSGSVNLPDQNSPDIDVLPTNGTSTIAVSARSVLGILEQLQASSTAFQITDLAYYSSFNSFLINCILVPAASSTPACYSWTDAVNGVYPQVGMDQQLLNDGDSVVLFFGSPHQVSLSANSVPAGQPFTVMAEQYDLSTGSYISLPGVTVGVGIANPDFTFTELATSTSDSGGLVSFTITAVGNFSVGIKEDYYSPAVNITITDPSSGGGSSGGGGVTHSNFNIPNGLAFISEQQNGDGSFDSIFATDWTALAFSSADPGSAKTKLKNYLLNNQPQMTSVTDYERHAMALEALGINPYNGTAVDYISPIVSAFDGKQIGEPGLDTDDIFAIFPLTKAGYGPTDPLIQTEVAYIISAQKPDGSWDESPDVTAAAIQAIGQFFMAPGYVAATGKAIDYLAQSQQADGGWGNIDSTSWVTTMLNAVKEGDPTHFVPLVSSAGYLPEDYIAKAQQTDGGVLSGDRVWSTSYAVTAASGIDWLNLLKDFFKPNSSGSGGGSAADNSTTTVPILPMADATSTPQIASSTPTAKPISNLATSTSPTVIAVQILPKQKTHKLALKNSNSKSEPQVLGVQTTSQTPVEATNDSKNNSNNNKPGFFTRLWQAIAHFFSSIF